MIEIRGLAKRFGGKPVLDGLDLDVRTGETLVVLGPSGTGKSVLLKLVIGLMTPDAGSIRIDGTEIAGLDERALAPVRRRFGMLFQGAALLDSMTVAENVALAMQEHGRGLDEAEVRRRVLERLEWVGLQDAAGLKPASLSGGMRKRAGLARALAMDPEYLLYDEPTTGLDPITADVINQLIRETQRRLRVTSVVVTHDIRSAYAVADRIVLLYRGRIRYDGTAGETRNTGDAMMRQFIEGSSQGPIQPV
jgi:phospholipid/cholesterol/gamma-HCH transport system ATP-binding protein